MLKSEPDAKGADKWHAVQWVQSAGATTVALAQCRAVGLWGIVLQPARRTADQVAEVHAVHSAVQM